MLVLKLQLSPGLSPIFQAEAFLVSIVRQQHLYIMVFPTWTNIGSTAIYSGHPAARDFIRSIMYLFIAALTTSRHICQLN